MFILLNELEDIKQISVLEESIKLCEDIGKFLQPLIAKISNAVEYNKNPFEGNGALNKEETASILTGLQTLSNPDERAAHDVLGSDQKFYIFLKALGEKGDINGDKAEKHLKNFYQKDAAYKTYFNDYLKKLSMLEKPVKDENDKKIREKFSSDIKKLSHNLQLQMNKLKTTLASKQIDKRTDKVPA
ncbi:MAG: hypothetical protein QXG00_06820 [Candidatus Woesearchaeota archaeon]